MENKLAISTASACAPNTVACRLREEFVTSYLHIAAVEDLAAIPRLASSSALHHFKISLGY